MCLTRCRHKERAIRQIKKRARVGIVTDGNRPVLTTRAPCQGSLQHDPPWPKERIEARNGRWTARLTQRKTGSFLLSAAGFKFARAIRLPGANTLTLPLTLAMPDCGTANPAMGTRCKGAFVPMADPLPESLLCMSRTLLTMQTVFCTSRRIRRSTDDMDSENGPPPEQIGQETTPCSNATHVNPKHSQFAGQPSHPQVAPIRSMAWTPGQARAAAARPGPALRRALPAWRRMRNAGSCARGTFWTSRPLTASTRTRLGHCDVCLLKPEARTAPAHQTARCE